MFKIFLEKNTGEIDVIKVSNLSNSKHAITITKQESDDTLIIVKEDIKNCMITAEGKIIFRVRDGQVITDIETFFKNLMLSTDSIDLNNETVHILKDYSDKMTKLNLSKANYKAFMKRVSEDKDLLLELSKNVAETAELITEAEEHLKQDGITSE